MPRRRNKRKSKFDSLPWKKLHVGLADEAVSSRNHYYDDDTTTSSPSDDLPEQQPHEEIGIFYNLEVLSSSDYRVDEDGRFIVNNNASETEEEGDNSSEHPTASSKNDDDKEGEIKTSASDCTSKEEEEPPKKKTKKQRKKKTKKKSSSEQTESSSSKNDTKKTKDDSTEKLHNLQLSWMRHTTVVLCESLCKALLHQQFYEPTPIQQQTLPPAILGRRNIVGAAPTGSGKTLAYLLPICQYLLEKSERKTEYLQALILAPTRELALQVCTECQKLCSTSSNICGLITGGLAVVKQTRVLLNNRPPIIVATPGRLWELMSSREHEHLNHLSQLKFLVIDEADRMIQQGSFKELVLIFDAIHRANPMDSDSEEDSDLDEEEITTTNDRMLRLPGIPGEAKVKMLDDVLKLMEQQDKDNSHNDDEDQPPEPVEMDEYDEMQDHDTEEQDEDDDIISLPAAPPVQRQTFVFSATLTLPPSASYVAPTKMDNSKKKKKGGLKKKATTVEGAIAEILEKSRAKGPTKVIDLTSAKKIGSEQQVERAAETGATTTAPTTAAVPSSSRLPDGLSLYKIECTKKHKDSHLYAYLVTTAQGASGPCLVFCNSIAAVHRVSATLRTLRLPVRSLHANMPQKARFKAVESLRGPKNRAIVVATDVAARGLDIPSVATVVHYDVARQVDTFIHRAGRTARGVGEGAVGTSLSLVSPDEDKAHDKVCEALDSKRLFQTVPMDGRLFTAAQERVNLASKIVACDQVETRAQKKNEWFQQAAEEAGLDLDDDLMDEGLAGGDRRDQQQLREAQSAKARLRDLLAQPMQTQRFGKFLSSNSAASAPETAPYVAPPVQSRRKKRKRGGKK